MTILDNQSTIDRIKSNTLLYPLVNVILSNYPPSRDIIKTYESSLDHIEDIVSKQSIVNELLHTKVPGIIVEFKYWVDNIRIFGPNTQEHISYSANFCNVRTPNEALLERKTYCCLLLGDVNYSYTLVDAYSQTVISKPQLTKFSNSYCVNVPLPIGSKYDSLQSYDELTLIRSGETMEGVNGCFVIGGFIKYLNNILKKPFNQPMVRHNEFDNQKSRMECLYSAGLDYENSYYVIASMVQPKQSHYGRGVNQIPIIDFIFSLQMNDNTMNKEMIISRKKSLINTVPIKYLFWAFGCQSDLEMMKYICPDMNDYGLIHTVRQAVLEGELHISLIKGLVDYSLQYGFIHFNKPLDMITARYIVGSIILSESYKTKVREKCKDDIQMYKLEIIRQTNRLLRTKFMPGINKLNSDEHLYELQENNTLTDEQRIQLAKQERERNQAICFELGNIVRQLYLIGNDIEPSMDRISLLNRRVRSGQQIEYEFKSFNNARTRECKVEVEEFLTRYNSLDQLKDMKSALDNKIQQIIKKTNINQSTSLLNSFKGVATKDKSKIKTQLLQLKNQSFCDSMIREIVIGTDQANATGGVQWEHRVVHPSHLYFIDPCYCPESPHQVGRNQQPTLYTYLTDGSLGLDIYDYIIHHDGYLSTTTDGIRDKYIIKLNGSNIGYIYQYDPVETLYKDLMEQRRHSKIVRDCSITLNHLNGVLDIWCDEGRLMNHFINVSKCFESTSDHRIKPRDDFIQFLVDCQNMDHKTSYEISIDRGYIELICSSMAVYNCTIASNVVEYLKSPWKFSHIALPLELLSYVCSINPSTPLNAGVRASYSSNHMKQAIGPTLRYPQCKYINEMNVLLSPQIPLVRTMNYDLLHYNDKPMGNNIIIAFLIYGDNQEDSFIVNRSSIENGFLVIDSIFTMQSEIKKGEESFKLPDENTPKNGNVESYIKLDTDTCLPKSIGERFYENDVLIGKTVQINSNDVRKSDASVVNNHMDACNPREANTRELRYVNKDKRIELNKNLKMGVFSQRRVGIAGDKFNSTNAQKATIGRIYDSEKMPYTSNGIRPDIIFNPPSIFKRNTCGQIYEPSLSKLAALLGCPIDSTPYSTLRSTEEIDELYNQLGLDPLGYEDLYDPESGRYMGKVFISTIQYQRQQHLVENKLNIRAGEGDIDKISGLPVKGRKRSGGQSIDRMGNDSINCAGAVNLLRDIHLEQGCKMKIAICNRCHKQFTYYSKDYSCWFCSNCGRHSDFTIKEVVQIQPLINQLFNGVHVGVEYRQHNPKSKSILEDVDQCIH